MLLRRPAGAGRRETQVEGGFVERGVVRCLRDVSKADGGAFTGVFGGTLGGRLATREVLVEL